MSARPITIAIAALGGQGGGVLSNWIRELAQANGYHAQSTSVPGVAQRTGATVYYLELMEQAEIDAHGREPVLALSAVAGDVDVVIAAEWMEAGRAVQRGFVTPDRTVLIASTHRAYAVSEKTALGSGIADSAVVMDAARAAARELHCFDMQQIAESCGAVISAALFGALGASGALPFTRAQFEAVLGGRGAGAQTNLRAFAMAWEHAGQDLPPAADDTPALLPDCALARRVRATLPESAQAIAWEACRQLVDYQDERYAEAYLARLERVSGFDVTRGGELTAAVARHLALWMCYQDVIRVADQKTRAARRAQIREEVRAGADELVYPVEFMHPRLEEICDILPRPIGAALLASPRLGNWLRRFFNRGRQVQTYHAGTFLMLWVLASLRTVRRFTLRHAIEEQRIGEWLARIESAGASSPALAVEIARCQRLLKGYSDTQERGWRNFSRIMEWLDAGGHDDAGAEAVRQLVEAALEDDQGRALDARFVMLGTQRIALRTVEA